MSSLQNNVHTNLTDNLKLTMLAADTARVMPFARSTPYASSGHNKGHIVCYRDSPMIAMVTTISKQTVSRT